MKLKLETLQEIFELATIYKFKYGKFYELSKQSRPVFFFELGNCSKFKYILSCCNISIFNLIN